MQDAELMGPSFPIDAVYGKPRMPDVHVFFQWLTAADGKKFGHYDILMPAKGGNVDRCLLLPTVVSHFSSEESTQKSAQEAMVSVFFDPSTYQGRIHQPPELSGKLDPADPAESFMHPTHAKPEHLQNLFDSSRYEGKLWHFPPLLKTIKPQELTRERFCEFFKITVPESAAQARHTETEDTASKAGEDTAMQIECAPSQAPQAEADQQEAAKQAAEEAETIQPDAKPLEELTAQPEAAQQEAAEQAAEEAEAIQPDAKPLEELTAHPKAAHGEPPAQAAQAINMAEDTASKAVEHAAMQIECAPSQAPQAEADQQKATEQATEEAEVIQPDAKPLEELTAQPEAKQQEAAKQAAKQAAEEEAEAIQPDAKPLEELTAHPKAAHGEPPAQAAQAINTAEDTASKAVEHAAMQ